MEKREKTLLASASVGVAAVALALVPVRTGAAAGASLAVRMAYPMCHANVFHAAANAWCLVALTHAYEPAWWELAVAYAVAVAVPSFVLSSTPTMGLSGACFALMGMMLRHVARKRFYVSCAVALAAVGLLVPNVNAWIHLWCLAVGFFLALLNSPAPWNRR